MKKVLRCPECNENLKKHGRLQIRVHGETVETDRYICDNFHNIFVTTDGRLSQITYGLPKEKGV